MNERDIHRLFGECRLMGGVCICMLASALMSFTDPCVFNVTSVSAALVFGGVQMLRGALDWAD